MKWRIVTIKISSNFEKAYKIECKESRRASQPITQFFGSDGNNVENHPKKMPLKSELKALVK